MTNHYYSRNPEVESKPEQWSFTLRGKEFRFKTDAGVFSKREVDFGSRLLIEAFECSLEEDQPIIDIGCGYGPIGLSVASLYPNKTIHMVDVNARAIDLSKENAHTNGIANVKVYESSVFSAVKEAGFAAVISNPPIRAGKKIVHEILEESKRFLAVGGDLLIVSE